MNSPASLQDDLFANLRSLAETTFPRRCHNCGREYADAAEFIAATRGLRGDHSGLKQSVDDDGTPIVELFRNCVCGSTMLESFCNRRDLSAEGVRRRECFEELLGRLVQAGIAYETARVDLLKLMRGQPAELLGLIRSLGGDALR